MKLVSLIAFAVLVGLGCVHYVQPRLFSGIAFRSVFTGLKLFFEHVKHAEEPCVEALDTIFSLKPSVFNPNTFPGDVRWQVSELENAAVLEPSARLTRIIIPSSDGQSDKIVATWVDILQDGRRSIPADDENYLMADYTHVLYLHGGVFVAGSSQSHSGFVSKLVRRLGNARALVVDYRLAPEHSLQQAVEDCTAAYIYLVMEKQVSPWRIVVIGDSAGGNLVYQMQAAILSRAFPQPVATVMISPWLDLYLDTDLHRKNAQTDKMLDISFLQKVADIVTRDDADTKLAFSPAHVNAVVTTPFPTSLVVSSSSELLHQDSVAIVKKLRAAGVKVEHKATAKHPHVFPCFSDILPEGNAALNHIVSWIREIVPY